MADSILERFLILFESDADEVKKGADEAGKSTDDLEKKINQTDKSTTKLGSSFLDLARSATAAITAAVSLGAVTAGVLAAANYADKLQETSEALGVNMQELESWGNAAIMAGGSAEGFQATIKNLSSSLAQMDAMGKSRISPFLKELGISLFDTTGKMRDAFALLPEIAEAFEGMTKQEAIGFGRKLGLDEGTIMLLQRGRREVDDLIRKQKELGTVTEEDARIAAEYNDALDETAQVYRVLFSRIAGDVLPALTWMVEKFRDFGMWAREHKGFLYGFFATLTGFMTFFAIKALIAAGAVAFLSWPLYAMGAIVLALAAAFGLLWDDFQKFAEGGKALLGPFWEWLLKVEQVAARFVKLLGDIAKYGVIRAGFMLGQDGAQDLENAQSAIATASGSSISSQTSNSIVSGARVNKENNVTIGEVNVQTQATDAAGIAGAIGINLGRQLRQTVNGMDDGVRG